MKRIGPLLIVLVIICFPGTRLAAQLNIQFQPTVHGATLDGVFSVLVNNNAARDFQGKMVITVREERGTKIMEARIPNVIFSRGLKLFSRSALKQSVIKFGTSSAAQILKQTGKFPEGEYEYCYEISLQDPKGDLTVDFFENCFSYNLKPLTPLLLIDPDDNEKLCNTKPTLVWQPPLPGNPSATYTVILCEIKEKQMPVEALSMNVPIFSYPGVHTTRLIYPSHLPELVKGKSYAWQVHYTVNNRLVLKSEIWTFKIDCDEKKDSVLQEDSYRLLKQDFNGDYYIARQNLKFSIDNQYGEGNLFYEIFSLKDPGKMITGLPVQKLFSGLNRFSVDLKEHGGFKSGEHYQLSVQLMNGQRYFLRFTYIE